MKKSARHLKILELVEQHEVETQEELTAILAQNGFETTQATVSRDIKRLGLIKKPSQNGKYRYFTPSFQQNEKARDKFKGVFSESVLSVERAVNMLCIKCDSGMAMAACAVFDDMKFEGVVGTLGGDDTIFVMMKSEQQAETLLKKLKNFMK